MSGIEVLQCTVAGVVFILFFIAAIKMSQNPFEKEHKN